MPLTKVGKWQRFSDMLKNPNDPVTVDEINTAKNALDYLNKYVEMTKDSMDALTTQKIDMAVGLLNQVFEKLDISSIKAQEGLQKNYEHEDLEYPEDAVMETADDLKKVR